LSCKKFIKILKRASKAALKPNPKVSVYSQIYLICFYPKFLIKDAASGPTKDKKKKKKANKGTDASKTKESPKQNQAAALKELEPEDKEEVHTRNIGMSSGVSHSKGEIQNFSHLNMLRLVIKTLENYISEK
jgi:hypothetical protein